MSTFTIRELRTRRRESPGGLVECVTAWRSRGQDFRFFFKETNNFKSTSGWFSRGRSERKRSKLWASSSRAGIFCFTLFFVTIGPFYSLRQTVTHVAPPSRTRVSTKKEKMRTHARSKGPLIEHYITMRSPIVCCACTLVGTTPTGASLRTDWLESPNTIRFNRSHPRDFLALHIPGIHIPSSRRTNSTFFPSTTRRTSSIGLV